MSWDDFYNLLRIKDFIYFISSPELQDYLFPVKLIFVLFAVFFFAGVIYFMINSSWLQYKFLEDVTEFFSWQSYGMRAISKRWTKIKKRIESGIESDFKLAIIEADDFLAEVLADGGYGEDNFEDAVKKAERMFSRNIGEILNAHEIRNFVVYDPDFKLSLDQTQKILDIYESSINNIGAV